MQKDSSHDTLKEALIAESKSRREQLNFIYVDPTGNDGALEYFGLKQKDTPAFVIHDQGKDAKFISRNVDAGSLPSFLDDFKVRTSLTLRCWLTQTGRADVTKTLSVSSLAYAHRSNYCEWQGVLLLRTMCCSPEPSA